MKGKTREKLKNNIHIQIKKYKGRTEYHDPYLYKDRQGKNKGTLHVFTQGKTREELKNITYIHNREGQRKNSKTLPIFKQGKTREELKNITHICIGKDKGGTEKQKPY